MPSHRNPIEYPKTNQDLKWILTGDGFVHLAAFGFHPGTVRLFLKENNQRVQEATITLHQPNSEGFWSLAFINVPQRANPYSVDLELVERETNLPVGTSPNLQVPAKGMKDNTRITYPLPSSPPTPPSFTAQGSTDSSQVSANLSGPVNLQSTAVISSGAWFAPFQNVPASNNWTLKAYEAGKLGDTKNPIKVGT
jgi:hypothetical protein